MEALYQLSYRGVYTCFILTEIPQMIKTVARWYTISMLQCLSCNKRLEKYQKKYCSNKCQKNFEYQQYISDWKDGRVKGDRGIVTKNFSNYITRYLREKSGEHCCLCGWDKIHPITQRCPLELDHIDGNSENNTENNLRLLCPNCHSLTLTYKNHNFGKGRLWRKEKYVKIV